MAISFKKYVDITSGVGGGASVARRDLLLRMYTTNQLVPPNTAIEITTIEDVGAYFGTTSEEYQRALFYFSFISKNITRPQKIGFYRYLNADTQPKIFGGTSTKAIGRFTPITDGSFNITIGGITKTIATDFTSATSLSDVATLIQTQIQAETEPQFQTATVVFNATRNSFDFVGGVAEVATISVESATAGTDIVNLIEWNFSATFSDGALAETITTCLDTSIDISNNFGSFCFVPQFDNLEQDSEVARWNDVQNNMFMFLARVDKNDAQSYFDELQGVSGAGFTIKQEGEFHELMPSCILGATNYNNVNSTQNYMFYEFDATPSVTSTSESNQFDLVRMNYYGNTQTAGQIREFYQRGIMMGLSTDAVDMNTYANEIWLKDAMTATFLSLLLSLPKVSANRRGRGLVLTSALSVVQEGLNNGVISVGTTLDNTQKLYIGEITNDPLAYLQVENLGYWIDVRIEKVTTQDNRVEYNAVYTLIYKKDDVIRKVVGTHILI